MKRQSTPDGSRCLGDHHLERALLHAPPARIWGRALVHISVLGVEWPRRALPFTPITFGNSTCISELDVQPHDVCLLVTNDQQRLAQ